MELDRKDRPFEFPDKGSWEIVSAPTTETKLVVPPFATLDQAKDRARRIQTDRLHQVRFTPAHGHIWPLWDPDMGYTAYPADYGLSPQLTHSLQMWTREWFYAADLAVQANDNVEFAMSEEWFNEGNELAFALATEIWPIGDVIPAFWQYHNSI